MRLAFFVWITLFLGFIILTIVCISSPCTITKPPTSPTDWIKSKDGNTWVGISLPHRLESHFYPLQRRLRSAGITLNLRLGINGKEISLDDYPLSRQYRQFFENNIRERESGITTVDYRGHLGCTLTHLDIIRGFAHSEGEGGLMMLEDDVDPDTRFEDTWPAVVAAVDKHDSEWDIVLGGFSASYEHHPYHKLNDSEPIYKPGFVKLHYWIGGFAYLIRNREVAKKIVKEFEPVINWHCDISLAESVRMNKLTAYGAMPVIWRHPGSLRLSSWDSYQLGNVKKIKTDTNR